MYKNGFPEGNKKTACNLMNTGPFRFAWDTIQENIEDVVVCDK